jgi:hypothetical protein
MNRAKKRLLAWFVLFGLIMAQLTAVAHACAVLDGAPAASMPAAQMAEPCDGTDMDDAPAMSAPCAAHCQFGTHSVNTSNIEPPANYTPPPVHLVVETQAGDTAGGPPVEPALARTGAPPVFASSSRLRI